MQAKIIKINNQKFIFIKILYIYIIFTWKYIFFLVFKISITWTPKEPASTELGFKLAKVLSDPWYK